MKGIDRAEALQALQLEGAEMIHLFAKANQVRIEHRGLDMHLCSIVNAKCGACTEDCKFCAQSAHNTATIATYGLQTPESLVNDARKAGDVNQAERYGIVTSGFAIEAEDDVVSIENTLRSITAENKVAPCASLGKVSRETLIRLRDAGLTRYHSNIETAESYFPQICTTREWSETVRTVKTAQEVGLQICCGGIIGLGESLEQRVAFLEAIRDLDADCVPINFFNPVEGTRLTHVPPLTPLECLKFVAVARLMLPDKEIRICGGREYNLRELQSWLLICGADGLMVGGYLTTHGRKIEDDLRMIQEAGFTVVRNGCSV